jgi:hypothetical protein
MVGIVTQKVIEALREQKLRAILEEKEVWKARPRNTPVSNDSETIWDPSKQNSQGVHRRFLERREGERKGLRPRPFPRAPTRD